MAAHSNTNITQDTLLAVDLFRDLAPDERASIATRCHGIRFDAGDNIVLQSEPRHELFFIVSGHVRVSFHSKPGKDVQFRELFAGESFGELAAIDGGDRSADVMALSDVFLGTLDSSDFVEIATRYPLVGLKLLRQMAAMIRGLSDRVVELSTLGVANRIHAEFLRLARQSGVSDNVSVIQPAPTHADLASRVSTQREAVTKEIGNLVKRGVLRRERGAITVADVATLQEMVKNVAES